MANFGMAVTVCTLLAKKFPDGYFLEELFDEVKQVSSWATNPEWLDRFLGNEGGQPHRTAEVACWRMDEYSKIYFDPSAKRYSGYDDQHLKEAVEGQFVVLGLEQLRLHPGG